MSDPANLAIEYSGLEVISKSNNKALSLECTNYPFIFKALGKKQVRNSTLAQERTENEKTPKGKLCKICSPPDVSSTGCHKCSG